MTDQPPAPAPPEKKEGAPPAPMQYILKFEPTEPFTETELFARGCVRGKVWITDKVPVTMRSLVGEETDKIDEAVRIKPGMSQREYNTLTTYYNLAYGIESVGDQKLSGSIEDRVKYLKGLASPILGRLSLAWIEFNTHVDELFVGKGGLELAKKS